MPVKTRTSLGETIARAANNGTGSGTSPKVHAILGKMETFAKAVALEEYNIDKGFAFDSGLIFPLMGINHLVTRGIFQSLDRITTGLQDNNKAGIARSTAQMAADKPDSFFEDAEKLLSENALEAVKACARISDNVLRAETEGQSITAAVTKSDIQTAELALRGIRDAVQTLSEENTDIEGLKKMAMDFTTISSHFSKFSRNLMPKLGNQRKFEK